MISESKYNRFKKQITKLEKNSSISEGRLAQIEQSLQEEFGVSTLKDAKLKLRRLKQKAHQNEEKFEKSFTRFEKRFKRLIENLPEED